MKVLLINGSARENGCTYLALKEVEQVLQGEGLETELLQTGPHPVQDCIGCKHCRSTGRCVFDDDVINPWLEKARKADGFVFGSPVYFAHPTGHVLALMDRLFYAGADAFAHKPAAAVVTARRAGTTAALDVLQKHFALAQMPIVGSTYWNMVFGPVPELVQQDQEGLQTMRNLGRNMVWMLRCIQAGKERGILPPAAEQGNRTNFNR